MTAVLSCRVIIELASIFMYTKLQVAMQIKCPKEGILSGLFSAANQNGDQYYDIGPLCSIAFNCII